MPMAWRCSRHVRQSALASWMCYISWGRASNLTMKRWYFLTWAIFILRCSFGLKQMRQPQAQRGLIRKWLLTELFICICGHIVALARPILGISPFLAEPCPQWMCRCARLGIEVHSPNQPWLRFQTLHPFVELAECFSTCRCGRKHQTGVVPCGAHLDSFSLVTWCCDFSLWLLRPVQSASRHCEQLLDFQRPKSFLRWVTCTCCSFVHLWRSQV